MPEIPVINPVMNPARGEVTIDYQAFDADSDAEIKLFYDTDNTDFDGILIADGLVEKDGAGRFVWNTEGVPTGDYFIYAMITDENNPPEFSYSQNTVNISEEADLAVTQTANTDSVGVGENLTYTVKVNNNDSINAKGVTLVQTLPENALFVSASLPPSQQENNTLTFDLGDLAGHTSTAIDIEIAAPVTADTITSNAFVTSRTFDPDLSNNVDPFTAQVDLIPPKLPDLAVTRIASPNAVNLGTPFTYTLTVTDSGSGGATDVILTENLFSGFNFVKATTSQGSIFFNPDSNVVTANLGNLQQGDQAMVNVTVKPIIAGNLVSTSYVTGNEAEPNIFNNSIVSQTTVNPVDPLVDTLLPFQITVSTLEDENDGDLDLDDISLREAILFGRPGATINFASNLIYADAGFGEGTIGLQLGELVINKDLTINGLGADKLTISGNNASGIFNIDDGDAFNSLDVNISGLTIADGNANFGGGIFNKEELLISNSTIRDNTAQFSGGGIFSDKRLIIENSTLSGNTAEVASGGGINAAIFLSIANTTISGNQAGNDGGGIFFSESSGEATLIVNSSTITQNTTNGNGGGIFSDLADPSDNLIAINNTIIAQNFDNDSSDGTSPDVWGEFSSNNRFNLIGDLGDNTSSSDFLTTEGNQVGTSSNPIDAMLGLLQNNGGPTFTHAPLPGSPVLDTANPLANVTVDQRGISRPQGSGFDIGAVEGELNPITIQPTDRRFFVGTRLGDRIVGDARNNNIGGAAGNDVIFGGAGNDHLSGHGGNNFLFGEDDDDRLWGGQMDDFLDGGDGSDRLFGQNGNDTLLGGQGIDLLEGGKGNDKMTGGEGKDIFQIRQSDFIGGTFVDQILDFNAAEGDRLRLVDISIDEVMFNSVGIGNDLELTFSFGGKVTLSGITNDVTFVATNVDFDATRLGNISPLA